MNRNPVVTSFRHFNAFMLGIAALVLLLACRKLSIAPSVPAIIIAAVSGIVAILSWHRLRTRDGVMLLGCTRRTFDQLQDRLLVNQALGAIYRPGRALGLVRELAASRRNKSTDDAALVKTLQAHFKAHPQQLTPRDSVLLAAWCIGLVLLVPLVAWLLLA